MEYTIDLNSVIIIESLEDDEIKTGTLLYKKLYHKFEALSPFKGNTQIKTCPTKIEFLDFLGQLVKEVRKGLRPIIQIECHGSEDGDGLITASGELIIWQELYEFLRLINIEMKNSLFLNMGVCEGGKVQEIVNIEKEAPFFCLIGSLDSLWNDEILIGFTRFYEAMFVEKDLLKAMSDILSNKNFLAWSSEKIFGHYYQILKGQKENGEYIKLADELIVKVNSERGYKLSNEQEQELRANFINDLRKEYNKVLLNTRNKFLMVDIYPNITNKYIGYNEWKEKYEV